MIHRYFPELAGRSVPRYTSYPTAADLNDATGAEAQRSALTAIADDAPVSLYVHIPYCQSICWYCGCNTGLAGRADRIEAYRDALGREMDLVAPLVRGRVGQVHFGGGTPNVLDPVAFTALARRLGDAFAIPADAAWAVEIDPRCFTPAHAEAMAAAGVRRISIGAQSFAPRVQAKIGRIQPLRAVADAVAAARRAGIAGINLDLMYGLPAQTLDDVAATIQAARTLDPDRIALFGYAHMPRLLPRQRRIDESALPGAEARFWQSALGHDLLVEAGFVAIGFDHFARPDDSLARAHRQGALRRNFQGFTDDPADALVALGASAISGFPGAIVQNEKHVGSYRMRVANGMLAGVRGIERDSDDQLRATIIERLLCDGTVDAGAMAGAAGRAVETFDAALERLAPLVELGIVALAGRRVTIAPVGRPYARLAALVFDRYRSEAVQRFSRAI